MLAKNRQVFLLGMIKSRRSRSSLVSEARLILIEETQGVAGFIQFSKAVNPLAHALRWFKALVALIAATLICLPIQAQSGKEQPLLGVLNRSGAWIIPKRFKQIIYISASQMFWANTKSAPTQTVVSNNSEPNPNWIIFDRNGHQVQSQLAKGCEPIMEWPPSQAALGTSFFTDTVRVGTDNGYGVADSFGRLIMPCKYERIEDVGEHTFWAKARPFKLDPICSAFIETIAPDILPINGFVQPYELFDDKGVHISTLPTGLEGVPQGHFVNGLLRIGRQVIDRTGKIVLDENCENFPSSLARAYDFQNRNHGLVYRMADDTLAPIVFLPDSNSPEYADPSYAAPIFVTPNRAIVFQKRNDGTRTGVVDKNGKWIVIPKSKILAYCDIDRFISSGEE